MADGAATVEVAAECRTCQIKTQRQIGAPTDPEAPPIWLNTTMSDQPDTISVGRADARNLMSRLRRKEWHKVGATKEWHKVGATKAAYVDATKAACVDATKAACVDATTAAYVDAAGITLKEGGRTG